MSGLILIVSNEHTASLLYGPLSEEYSVVVTESADSTVDDHEPDLVILDLDVDNSLSEIRRQSDVPIIAIGADSATMTLVRILEEGADLYLAKPFAIRELGARVKALLRRTVPA